MILSALFGVLIAYVLTFFEVNFWFINTVQPYITFQATDVLYYVAFAILGCILFRN